MAWENNRPTHVPTRVRDACLHRDGYRCTQVQNNGTRCTETTNLEAAHHGRRQRGEKTTINHVRTLCHWHHNRETQKQAAEAAKKKRTNIYRHEQHPALR